MLTILNDPAGITGRRRIEWKPGRTVFEHIVEAMPHGGGDCAVRFNGAEINPAADPRMASLPRPDDDVVVAQRPEGLDPATWSLIISFVLAAYSYTLIPRPVDQPTQSSSPNNQLASQTNIARAYQAIPDVYGMRRCWPDLIQPSTVEYVSNVKLITEWLCVSRGRGTISAIKFAETPLVDIGGASSSIFEPAATPNTYAEDNDTTLTDVYETFASADVNGQELSNAPSSIFEQGQIETFAGSPTFTIDFQGNLGNFESLKAAAGIGTATVVAGFIDEPINDLCSVVSFVETGTPSLKFTFTRGSSFSLSASYGEGPVTIQVTGGGTARGPFTLPVASDQIWCNFAFLRGLVGSVQVQAAWWAVDASGAEITGTRETATLETFLGGSFDQQFFTRKITPAAGLRKYKIQFTRLTADLGNGADVCKLEEVYAVRYYATKVLPGVTVVKVTKRATSQALGGELKQFNVMWQRHVRTLTSTTISASRNFARALLHLWAISGNDAAEIDTAALAAINTALGEDSSLARFDWSFDDANLSLGERLQIIANAARGVLWRDGNVWTVSRDQAKTTPELQLDYRNLASDGDSSISYAAHLPASEDGVEIEFVEEVEQSRKDFVRLDISSGSVVSGLSARPKKIKLIGCATRAQALNRAHLEARKLLYQRTSVQDTALADAASLGPSSLVRWIDPHDFYADDGLQGGEVLGISGSVITVSEPLQWGAETTGRMTFTDESGLTVGPVVVTPVSETSASLSSVPAGLYVRDDTRQLGSRFAFGSGLSAAEIAAAGLYTVVSVTPASDRTVGVALVNYDARIYAMDANFLIVRADEFDSARTISSNIRALVRADEGDSARPIGAAIVPVLGRASENDSATAITARLFSNALELDSALLITVKRLWNPSDKDADISLTSADSVASITAPNQGALRAITGRDASGDYYFEVTAGGTDGRVVVGIGKSSATLANHPGFDSDGYGYFGFNGNRYTGATPVAYGATFGSGDVIGVRLNSGTLTFYKNGTTQGAAYSGLSGTFYPMWGSDTSATGTRTGTLETGAPVLYLPSGATPWG